MGANELMSDKMKEERKQIEKRGNDMRLNTWDDPQAEVVGIVQCPGCKSNKTEY